MYNELMAMARRIGRRDSLHGLSSNFGYTAFVAGEWDAAMDLMDATLAEDMADRERMIMLNNATIIRANRGEPVEENLARMVELMQGMEGALPELFLADPTANLALATGDMQAASANFYMIGSDDRSQMPECSYRASRPAMWAGDLDAAKKYHEAFSEHGTHGVIASAREATIQAGIAALEGRSAEAMVLYRDALRGWRETHSRWDEALTGVDMAELLDPNDPEVADVIRSTRVILEGLRARPCLERLDAAVTRRSAAPPRAATTAATEVPVSS